MALFFALFWGNSAAPAAGSFARGGKGTKTPFWEGPPWLAVSTGGQNLSGYYFSFRATGPWRREVGVFSAPWGRLACAMLFGWLVDGGPMRHRPLLPDDVPFRRGG